MTAGTHRRTISVILVPFLVAVGREEICCWLHFSLVQKNHILDVRLFQAGFFSLLKSLGNFKVSQQSRLVFLNLSNLFLRFHFHHQHCG